MSAGALTKEMQKLDHAEIRLVLEREARDHPYLLYTDVEEVSALPRIELPDKKSKLRFLPQKSFWHVSEFFVFEGDEFADGATLALRNRLATQEEKQRLQRDSRAPHKLWVVFELDRQNRNEGSGVRVYGAPLARFLWSVSSTLFEKKCAPLAKPFRSYFRKSANRIYLRSQEKVTLYRLIYSCLDGINRQ